MERLIHGDALEEMSKLIKEGIKVDAIITDPPYGTTSCAWDSIIPIDLMWDSLHKLSKETTPIALFGTEPFSSLLRVSNIEEYKYDWIYVKSLAQGFLNANRQPLRNNELISVFYKKLGTYNPQMSKGTPYKAKRGGARNSVTKDKNIKNGGHLTINNGERYPLAVLDKYTQEREYHETQKPLALIEYLVRTYTNEGDTVLDFSCGSGTTLVA